mgnify:CR=1 FL=1
MSRGYVERQAKALAPTQLGEITTELLKEHFDSIVDVGFTAGLEDDLDKIEEGEADWVATLHHFYDQFDRTLQNAEKAMEGTRIKIPDEETDIVCELCGRKMVIKTGRYGKFFGPAPGFPRVQKSTKGHHRGDRRALPPLRRQDAGEEIQAGAEVLRLRAQPQLLLYDLGPAHPRDLPQVRRHPL